MKKTGCSVRGSISGRRGGGRKQEAHQRSRNDTNKLDFRRSSGNLRVLAIYCTTPGVGSRS